MALIKLGTLIPCIYSNFSNKVTLVDDPVWFKFLSPTEKDDGVFIGDRFPALEKETTFFSGTELVSAAIEALLWLFMTSFLLTLDDLAASDFPIVNLVILLIGDLLSSLHCPKASLFRVREFAAFDFVDESLSLGVDSKPWTGSKFESSEQSLLEVFEFSGSFCEKREPLVGGEGITWSSLNVVTTASWISWNQVPKGNTFL